MPKQPYVKVTRETLRVRLDVEQPDNEDPYQGFALVNVLDPEHFAREHIPGSINIPAGDEREFEKRYRAQKEIIVYGASPECNAAASVAQELARRGFVNVFDYDGGLSRWKEAGHEVEGGQVDGRDR